jgi:galactose oxidase
MNRPRRLRNWLLAGLLAASALRCGDNVAPPNAKTIQMTSGDGQSGPAQQPLPQPLVVLVTDDAGNPVAGVTVHWTPDEGTVSNSDVKTGSDGHASVQRVLGPTAGQQMTTAAVAGLDGSPVTFTATALPAGSPGIALVTQPPSSALDAEVFDPTNQPVIALSDDQGNPRAGVQVTARIASGGGTLEGTTTATTDANGRAAFGDLGIRGPGPNTIQFAAGAATVTSAAITISPLPAEASTGAWGPVVQWDIVPLQMTLFPNGKIFAWGKRDPADSIGKPHLWDPAAGPPTTATEVGGVSDMLFCAGHTLLPDGRLITAGGHFMDDAGIKATYFFSQDGSAQKGPDMAFGRWYPTLTVLDNGRVLSMAGRNEQSTTITIPEIWEGNQWVQLPGGSDVPLPYYPRNFVDPNPSRHGQVFMSGERIVSRWFDVDGVGVNGGRGKWTTGPSHKYTFNRDYGTAVMYETGKILYAGGGGYPRWSSPPADKSDVAPTPTAETIDLNSGSPTWQFTAPMQFARRHLNSTVLPDGEVLVTGGVGGGTSGTGTTAVYNFNDLSKAVHQAEIWSPKTGQWTTLASNAVNRGYHSVSILLPDGTVLHGSSGDAQIPPQNPGAGSLYPNEKNHEIFSPPYLFKGARPKITSAPTTVGYGAVFSVATPNAAQVTEVRWIRVGSVTHAFDMSARANSLTFTRTASGVDVTAPSNGDVAPPGYYLLFILNRNGVPSEGQFIKIG